MILNDKPNCQVSRILMKPRPILSDSLENDPELKNIFQYFLRFLIQFGKEKKIKKYKQILHVETSKVWFECRKSRKNVTCVRSFYPNIHSFNENSKTLYRYV
jgi:hypothetical protein